MTVSAPSARSQVSVKKTQLNVAILIFDGVQIIDYTGPYAVFGAAQSIALGLEYRWDRNSTFLPATLARSYMPKARRFMFAHDAIVSSSTGKEARWEEVIKLNSELSAEELLKEVNDNLATVAKWAQKDSGSSDPKTSLWEFADENGTAWDGAASVRRDAGETNKWLVTIKIARRG